MGKIFFLLISILCTESALQSGSDKELGKQLLLESQTLSHYNPEAAQFHSYHSDIKKSIEKMIDLIKKGADVNVSENNWAAIFNISHALCIQATSWEELLDLFAQEGAQMSVCNAKLAGESGAALATQSGDIYYLDKSGCTTVFSAALPECALQKLLNHGLKPSPGDAQALFANFDREKELKLLLEAGIHADVSQEDGMTPLMMAAMHNKSSCVKLFISKLQKIDQKIHGTGETALHYAFKNIGESLNPVLVNEKYQIINALIQKGISINITNKEGATPLIYAVKEHDAHDVEPNQRLIDLVVALGADPLQKDSFGLSALHYAHHKGLNKLVAALLSAIEKYQPDKRASAYKEAHMAIENSTTRGDAIKNNFYEGIFLARNMLAIVGTVTSFVLAKNCIQSRRK